MKSAIKPRKSIAIVLALFLFLLGAKSVSASGFCFKPESDKMAPNQSFKINFLLDAGGSDVNVVSGKVIFPSDILEFERTEEGKSIINYWVEKPKAESGSQIVFSGGLSGGFSGDNGLLFSVVFRAKEDSLHKSGKISAGDMQIFLNDGRGTRVDADAAPFNFTVTAEEIGETGIVEKINDVDSPQDFIPFIARNPSLFDNRWFAAFYARDEETGIDHYEVWESNKKYDINNIGNAEKNKWVKTESPHLLENQKLQNYIYVKAVDKAGNEKVRVIPPAKNNLAKYKNAVIAMMIIALLVLMSLFIWKISAVFKNRT